MDNSIPICRSILSHWVYQDAEYLKTWVTMLSRARYMEEPKTVIYEKSLCTLNYGQFIFGRKAWSDLTKISEQRLRTLVKKLIEDNMIQLVHKTNHFSIYQITNYAKFNHPPALVTEGLGALQNQQSTSSQPAVNQQSTTNEEGSKKDKEIYIEHFEEFWKLYPKKTAKTAALKNWKTLITSKINHEGLVEASKGYAKAMKGNDPQFILQASTFLGPQKRYEDYMPTNEQDEPTRPPLTITVVERD